MNFNGYNEVINGPATYKEIAEILKNKTPVLLGFTDNDATHYDILFNYGNIVHLNRVHTAESTVQRGIRETDLFVSILGTNSYGFNIDTTKHESYICEKLFNGRMDYSVSEVAKLINGVIEEMNNG